MQLHKLLRRLLHWPDSYDSFGSTASLQTGATNPTSDAITLGTLTPVASTPDPATYGYVASGLGAAWVAGRRRLSVRNKRLTADL